MDGHPLVKNPAILLVNGTNFLCYKNSLAELQNMWRKVQDDQGLERKLENKGIKTYYIKPWGSAPYLYNRECLQNKQPAQQRYD